MPLINTRYNPRPQIRNGAVDGLECKAEISYVKEVFKLNDGEADFLTTCLIGEGLFKVGQDTAILKITPTKKEFEFVETNLNKIAKKE